MSESVGHFQSLERGRWESCHEGAWEISAAVRTEIIRFCDYLTLQILNALVAFSDVVTIRKYLMGVPKSERDCIKGYLIGRTDEIGRKS